MRCYKPKYRVNNKPEYPEKTTDLPQVTDKLYHTSSVQGSNL